MSDKYTRHGEVRAVQFDSVQNIGKVLEFVVKVCKLSNNHLFYAKVSVNCFDGQRFSLLYEYEGNEVNNIFVVGDWLVYDPTAPWDEDLGFIHAVKNNEFKRLYKNA